MQVKKQQLELDMKQLTGLNWGKEYIKNVYCHSAYLTSVQNIMQNAGLDESQARIKFSRRNINSLRCADDTTLMTESEEELNSILIRVKRRVKKLAWNSTLKKNKTKIMAPSPTILWLIEGVKVEAVTDFVFLGF